MDANPCACESPRSQLPHAQGFISISLTVAPEYPFENVEILTFPEFSPEFTAFSCVKLKRESDQSSSFRGDGVHRMGTNLGALERPWPQLFNAQEFISISRTVASEYSLKMRSFQKIREFSQICMPPGKIKQNPKSTTLFFNIQKYFAATMIILKKIQSYIKSSAK